MSDLLGTLDFPPAKAPGMHLRAPPALAGVALRPALKADIRFLRELYGGLRRHELARVPWPETARQAFLDQQFAFQHRHYTTQFPAADYAVIEQAKHAIGRLYLDRATTTWQLIDIALQPSAQGHGIGSTLIRHVQTLAQLRGASLALHVQIDNARACALYERLGFEAGANSASHLAMHWSGSCPLGEAPPESAADRPAD